VYLETSVISYLTGRTSRDLRIATEQRITRVWWEDAEFGFDLYVSELVLLEVSAGDARAAERRVSAVRHLPLLAVLPESIVLARSLLSKGNLPKKAIHDALHLAIAAVHGMDFLVTWDRRHLANESRIPRIGSIIVSSGHASPVICTPLQLRERMSHEGFSSR